MEPFAEGSELNIVLQYRAAPNNPTVAERNRKAVLDALDKVAAGDADGFWSIFDPDVVFYEAPCLPYGGAHVGLEATKKAFLRLSEVYSSNHAVFEEVLSAGNLVIAYQTISFRVRKNGNSGTLPVAELFRFRSGKVIEWRALYFDSHMVARAISGNEHN